MTIPHLFAIVSAGVFSGLIGVIVTLLVQRRRELRQRKLDCLRRVAAYRAMPIKEPWLEALNEIFVTFNQSPKVLKALSTFERNIRATGGHRNEDLLDLIKAMMADLKLSREGLDDEFLLSPFRSKQQS
jgi:uncharacterized protein DUF6680